MGLADVMTGNERDLGDTHILTATAGLRSEGTPKCEAYQDDRQGLAPASGGAEPECGGLGVSISECQRQETQVGLTS